MAVVEFRVRMPPALHEQLKAQAAEQGVSLNQLCVALLAGGSAFRLSQMTNAEIDSAIREIERRRHASKDRPGGARTPRATAPQEESLP